MMLFIIICLLLLMPLAYNLYIDYSMKKMIDNVEKNLFDKVKKIRDIRI